jgi:hypothetical protein
MSARALHLHTYFLFPFSIDKEGVRLAHKDAWWKGRRWLEGLDSWISSHSAERSDGLVKHLGPWQRDSYTRFDLESQAYQDMVFFHPFMRRVFFDVRRENGRSDEVLLHCYVMRIPEGQRLWFQACDTFGVAHTIEVTDLRLFLFANGMGVFSFGVEARDLPVNDVLWINESFRKIYPSSGRQVKEGRMPCDLLFVLERNGEQITLVHENELSKSAEMIGVMPPLSKTVTAPLYFLDYVSEEFEPVLDERMIVYSYVSLDPASVPENFKESEEYQVLLSRLLYVDRGSDSYRYEPQFTRDAMKRQMYTRWAHQGTYYGFTSFSQIAVTLGTVHRDFGRRESTPLIHQMFTTRYYMMALVALFYRATLLDFAERTALMSKTLYLDQWDGELKVENIRITDGLRAEFLHFSSHWYFTELANKDEETEHFDLQCHQYRIEGIHKEISEELDALNSSLHNYHQFRNTEALNRLGMLSMILGAGAVTTGFFGMNFQVDWFSEGLLKGWPHLLWIPNILIAAAVLLSFGALIFGVFLVLANWFDYKDTLLPNRWRAPGIRRRQLKKELPT